MIVHAVVADPRAPARAALSSLVASWGWEVAATASDGLEAVRLARELKPELLLVDSSAGGLDVASLFGLLPESSAPLVVRLVDRPQELSRSEGLAILKGVPADRMRVRIEGELKTRGKTRP